MMIIILQVYKNLRGDSSNRFKLTEVKVHDSTANEKGCLCPQLCIMAQNDFFVPKIC